MADCKCRKPEVVAPIARNAVTLRKAADDFKMPGIFGQALRNEGLERGEKVEGLENGTWFIGPDLSGCQAQKSRCRQWMKMQRFLEIATLLEPVPRNRELRSILPKRIDQKIRVGQDHGVAAGGKSRLIAASSSFAFSARMAASKSKLVGI